MEEVACNKAEKLIRIRVTIYDLNFFCRIEIYNFDSLVTTAVTTVPESQYESMAEDEPQFSNDESNIQREFPLKPQSPVMPMDEIDYGSVSDDFQNINETFVAKSMHGSEMYNVQQDEEIHFDGASNDIDSEKSEHFSGTWNVQRPKFKIWSTEYIPCTQNVPAGLVPVSVVDVAPVSVVDAAPVSIVDVAPVSVVDVAPVSVVDVAPVSVVDVAPVSVELKPENAIQPPIELPILHAPAVPITKRNEVVASVEYQHQKAIKLPVDSIPGHDKNEELLEEDEAFEGALVSFYKICRLKIVYSL